jgi:uncharacterized RDD family membrane protein YckC
VVVLVTVLGLSVLAMLASWRRDGGQQRIALPRELVLAEYGNRVLAAAVDLVPCVVVAAVFFHIAPVEILMRLSVQWLDQTATWDSMLPGFVAAGIYAVYGAACEAFTGRTPGKALLGLRVVGLTGKPPDVWQVLARNALHILDVLEPLLLVLVVLGPGRQRLGDRLARTVVVTVPKPEEDEEDEDEEER